MSSESSDSSHTFSPSLSHVPSQPPIPKTSLSSYPSKVPHKGFYFDTITKKPVPPPTVSSNPSTTPSYYPTVKSKTKNNPQSMSSSASQPPSWEPSVSIVPSDNPTSSPSLSIEPSKTPSHLPSTSNAPSKKPSKHPSISKGPSIVPSNLPSVSRIPSDTPSRVPSVSADPSQEPSSASSTSRPKPILKAYPKPSPKISNENCAICTGEASTCYQKPPDPPVRGTHVSFLNATREGYDTNITYKICVGGRPILKYLMFGWKGNCCVDSEFIDTKNYILEPSAPLCLCGFKKYPDRGNPVGKRCKTITIKYHNVISFGDTEATIVTRRTSWQTNITGPHCPY